MGWVTKSLVGFSSRFIPLLHSADEKCLCVVVGMKSDLLTPDMTSRVSAEAGIRLARELNKDRHFETETPYFETSSLLNKNVDDVFQYIFQTLLPLEKGSYSEMTSKRSRSLLDLESPVDSKKDGSSTNQKRCC